MARSEVTSIKLFRRAVSMRMRSKGSLWIFPGKKEDATRVCGPISQSIADEPFKKSVKNRNGSPAIESRRLATLLPISQDEIGERKRFPLKLASSIFLTVTGLMPLFLVMKMIAHVSSSSPSFVTFFFHSADLKISPFLMQLPEWLFRIEIWRQRYHPVH